MSYKRNWKQFFLNSLKSKTPINRDNLYINEKKKKGSGSNSLGRIQIISPTAQATNQARETVKSNIFKQGELQRVQRKIKKPRTPKKRPKKRPKSSSEKTPRKKSSTTQRKYK